MKASTRAVLLVAAVFVVGAIGGVVGSRMVLRNLPLPPENVGELPIPPEDGPLPDRGTDFPRDRPGVGGRGPMRPGPGRPGQRSPDDILPRMVRQLGLDETQAAQVREILQKSRRQQVEAGHEHQQRMRQLRRQTLEEIRGVLKPEQAQHLQRMIRRIDDQERRVRDHRRF